MNYLDDYYNRYDEENRLLSRHGQVEYITTRRYIDEALAGDKSRRILEIGAGTGRYSVALAKEGYDVTAVELIAHNIEVLKSKLDGSERIYVIQGNALDLSRFTDDSFDLTLVLGPMYHLYSREDQLRALREAVRVTKPGGFIMVAYCMNEPTVINFVFQGGNLGYVMENGMLTEDWHCVSEPKELFELIRVEEIAELDAAVGVSRVKLVATDGATNYMRQFIDALDDATFEKWVEYHLCTCERQELVGASHHTLDILRKNGAVLRGESEQIKRVRHFEELLDALSAAAAELRAAQKKLASLRGMAGELESYYSSEAWKKDYSDDEAGLLPKDLKRGVLSQDAVYDLLEELNELEDMTLK